MVKNSAKGNKERTARYRAALAARGIRPVQVIAPEGAHTLLRQAAALMTREQDPLDPRAALRQAGSANEVGLADNPEQSGPTVPAEVEAARSAKPEMRVELAGAEKRPQEANWHAQALAAELAQVRAASERIEQEAREQSAQVAAALARADTAEQEREKATLELMAVRVDASTFQKRLRAVQEAADALRVELEGVRDKRGWKRVLLRLVGV